MSQQGKPSHLDPNVAYKGLTYTSSFEHLVKLAACIYELCSDQEWAWYIQFVAQILCRTPSAPIAVNRLKTFLSTRTHLQVAHEGIRCELFDSESINLPTVLTFDTSDPVFIHFKKWTLGRTQRMTVVDRKRARGEMLLMLEKSLDLFDEIKAEKAAAKAKRAKEAQKHFEPPTLMVVEEPPRGTIGVVDLTKLLDALSIEDPEGLAAPAEASSDAKVQPRVVSWLEGLMRTAVDRMKRH
jgi:hypothetical protein